MRCFFPVQLALTLLLGIFLCLLADPRLSAPSGRAHEASSEKKIDALIGDLKSDRFETREAATQALMDLDDEPPALRQAAKSPDPEVRRRVAQIREVHRRKRASRGLRRACLLAKEARVDEMIERLILWRDWGASETEWRAVAELAVRLVEWEHRTFENMQFLAGGFFPIASKIAQRSSDLSSIVNSITLKELADLWTRSLRYVGNEIVLNQRQAELSHCFMILASAKVRTPRAFGCLLIANGSIHIKHGPSHSIIICAEDLEVSHGLSNCLVVCRGKITCQKDSKITHCTILSGGPVVFSESLTVEHSAFFSGASIEIEKGVKIGKGSLLRSSLPDLPLKFFDPEAAGLTVWQVYRNNGALPKAPPLIALDDNCHVEDLHVHPELGAGVQIKNIRKGTPFATGLHESDIITAIDERKTPSKGIFRKVLRRKLAESGPISFTVRRAGKTMDVPILLKDG